VECYPGVPVCNACRKFQRMDRSEPAKFRLDLEDERLWDREVPVRLTQKAFELLRFLVRNPNRLLTREEVSWNLWRDVHVSEGLIKEYVHDLRRALGDDPRSPKLIETVRGRGYRFLGGIDLTDATGGLATVLGPVSGMPSLAVLPIECLADDERWAHFCLGISEDLVTELSRCRDFTVVSKGSSFAAYQGNHADIPSIARDLNAEYLLCGSAQVSGDELRMSFHLVDARRDRNVWANSYERKIEDLSSVQREVVGRVVSALTGWVGQVAKAERIRLAHQPPDNLEAHELYLLGFELEERHEKASTLKSFELLRRALTLNGGLARAWVALGWACFQIWTERWANDPQLYEAMEREACLKAARLDPEDPLAVMSLARVRALDGDREGASEGLEQAVDLGRNQADILATVARYFALVLDDPARAGRLMEQSRDLSPLATDWYFMHWTRISYISEDYENALSAAKLASDLQSVRLFEILSLAQLGRKADLRGLRSAFSKRYPKFDLSDFVRSQVIVGDRAKALVLDGISKAGLD
jgi:TolB-like protein/DNA-binding winged helix-turn-helix (wHTH) protein